MRNLNYQFLAVVCLGAFLTVTSNGQVVTTTDVMAAGAIQQSANGKQIRGTFGQVLVGNANANTLGIRAGYWEMVGPVDTPTGLTDELTDVEDGTLTFGLAENYPNPFSKLTTMTFSLAAHGHASLTVYSLLGERVATLVDDMLPAGTTEATWAPVGLAAGTYFFVLRSGKFREVRRAVLVR